MRSGVRAPHFFLGAAAADHLFEQTNHMIDIDFERLRPIGLTASLTQHLAQELAALGPDTPPESRLMRITEVQRDACTLDDGWQTHRARAVPALHKALQSRG